MKEIHYHDTNSNTQPEKFKPYFMQRKMLPLRGATNPVTAILYFSLPTFAETRFPRLKQ
jgi:hypothetical protein